MMPRPTPSVAGGRRVAADRVARIAAGLVTLALVVMLGRVVQLQLAPSDNLRGHIQARQTIKPVPASRGDVVDRRFRYVATTQFGYRAIVDPTLFPSPPDEAILKLAQATMQDPVELGQRIVGRMLLNQARLEARARAQGETTAKDVFDVLRTLGRGGSLPAAVRTMRTTPVERRPGGQPAAATAQAPGDDDPASDDPGQDSITEAGQIRPRLDAEAPLIRYLVVSGVLSDDQVQMVKELRLPGVQLELRGVRQYPAGDLVGPLVGKTDPEQLGLIGIERHFDQELRGRDGRIAYVRDARGRPLWMGASGFEPARRGDDVRLSIDLEIQRIAHEELTRRVEECDAAGGRCVVMDPATGEILAMVDVLRPVPDAVPFPWPDARPRGQRRGGGLLYEPPPPIPRGRYIVLKPDPERESAPELARNRCVEDVYEPGSTFKSFVWATATELGIFNPDSVINTGGGTWRTPYGRRINDVHKHDTLTWREVLIESSNIGMSQAADRMSFDQLSRAVRRFGFGSLTGLGLPGEARGLVTPRSQWSRFTQTSVSFGQEIAVTPVQMVQAFAAFARSGSLAGTMPRARLTAAAPDDPERSIVNRVLRSDVAILTREILHASSVKIDLNMAREKADPPPRYSMFGKSGTAQIPLGKPPEGKMRPPGMGFFDRQYNSSFIAGAPLEQPRLVVLVVIDDPGPALRRTRQHYGSTTAGPAVRRIVERSLAYLGVPPSPVVHATTQTASGMAD